MRDAGILAETRPAPRSCDLDPIRLAICGNRKFLAFQPCFGNHIVGDKYGGDNRFDSLAMPPFRFGFPLPA
jgi:hypothetical protein